MSRPVLFFGRLSVLTAVNPDRPTDSDRFRAAMAERHPELADPAIKLAVNKAIVTAPVTIDPDDEVAFLAPMSGG